MPQDDDTSLWHALCARGPREHQYLRSARASIRLSDLSWGSSLNVALEEFCGRSVLVATEDQMTAALVFLELDGIARRLVLCTPDLSLTHLLFVAAEAEVDYVVSDRSRLRDEGLWPGALARCSTDLRPLRCMRSGLSRTEWVLLTSGTTGPPKMVVHTLDTLTGAIESRASAGPAVWSSFYDVRRYGGLLILLRALLDGRTLVLSNPQESPDDFLIRAASHGVTHMSGTPSHWRRALMTPAAREFSPQYVRLSGEIADQGILDRLHSLYPDARIVHAFATTEAGLAFEVTDRRAGFPAELIDQPGGDVEMKIEDCSLRIRSPRRAIRYLGAADTIADNNGFVDSRDIVERRGDRYYFMGRRDGIINVGGLKVHPEEVESVINRHPNVQVALVKGRKNPITGAVVVADVVVKSQPASNDQAAALRDDIKAMCRRELVPYKIPVVIRFVPALDCSASGKLARV
jgi:acyl-coenzyme A synthetase/AMP-(fatty) acid ligase